MTASHYDTLGVPREASADEIKRAWRAKASAAHPDRNGGSTEDMQAINRAYEVLSDSARRAQYDASGTDQLDKPVEDEARDMLLGAFSQVLDRDGDWLLEAEFMLQGVRAQIEAHFAEATAKRGRLVKRRGKVRAKGENLLHGIIDQHIDGLAKQLASMERARKVQTCAMQMLRAYELDPDGEPQLARLQALAFGMGTQTSGVWR